MAENQLPAAWTFDADSRVQIMRLSIPGNNDYPKMVSPDAIDEVVASFARSAATPEPVSEILGVSVKLLKMSVIHYEFAAVAVEKTLQALEAATRFRLGVDSRVNFSKLLKSPQMLKVLSPSDIDEINTGRELRNTLFSHPTTAAALPIAMVVGLMSTSHRLITKLFPDS